MWGAGAEAVSINALTGPTTPGARRFRYPGEHHACVLPYVVSAIGDSNASVALVRGNTGDHLSCVQSDRHDRLTAAPFSDGRARPDRPQYATSPLRTDTS